MNFVRSNNLSLKYQKVTPSSCKDIRILKFGFVAKTQFLIDKNEKYYKFHLVAKILGFLNLGLWLRLNSFLTKMKNITSFSKLPTLPILMI